MNEYLETLKEVIRDNFMVYGADSGLKENAGIIMHWRDEGEIDEQQYKELRKYNRKVYSELPLDM